MAINKKLTKSKLKLLDRGELRKLVMQGMAMSLKDAYKLDVDGMIDWLRERSDEFLELDLRPFLDDGEERSGFRDGIVEFLMSVQAYARGETTRTPTWPLVEDDIPESWPTPPVVEAAPEVPDEATTPGTVEEIVEMVEAINAAADAEPEKTGVEQWAEVEARGELESPAAVAEATPPVKLRKVSMGKVDHSPAPEAEPNPITEAAPEPQPMATSPKALRGCATADDCIKEGCSGSCMEKSPEAAEEPAEAKTTKSKSRGATAKIAAEVATLREMVASIEQSVTKLVDESGGVNVAMDALLAEVAAVTQVAVNIVTVLTARSGALEATDNALLFVINSVIAPDGEEFRTLSDVPTPTQYLG